MRITALSARSIWGLVLLGLMASVVGVSAQENHTAIQPPCIAADEAVYRPVADGVKPPQPPQPDKNKNAPDMRGPFSMEVIVNSQGRVCDARVFNAKDQISAEKAARYIADHWTFTPATRRGKPVAVKFTMNIGSR